MSAPSVDIDSLNLRQGATALEARYYTDPALYELERDAIFHRTWQYAGHLSQLQMPGDYFTFEILEERLFCVLDREHQVRCFYNVCQHRAHHLLEGAGRVRNIVCPYHAWTYGLDGQFKRAPNEKNAVAFDKNSICLPEIRVELFHGFVFVNLDDDAAPMDDWYPGAREELADYVPQIDGLRPITETRVEEDCNWKVSVENYSECYHCSLNHPTFANGVIDPKHYNVLPQGYCLRHTTKGAQSDAMTYTVANDADQHKTDYSSWYLWPTLSFQVYPGAVLNTYHWQPTGVGTVTVDRGWFAPENAYTDEIEALAQQDLETTVAEDVRLVNSVQTGLKSKGYRPGPLLIDENLGLNSEHSIAAFQRWVKEALD